MELDSENYTLNFNDTLDPVVTFHQALSEKFGILEYAVFISVLVISTGIGLYFWLVGKQNSTEMYLMADRKMSSIPVALSLLCSFVSAITLLGHPAEIYLYGAQHSLLSLSFIPMTFVLAYFYVPVYFNIQVGSCYQYLELRFDKSVRILISFLGIIYWLIYMAVVVYGPALALEQVTGMSVRISTASIFLVCIFYSTLGGLKTVLWTDSFQALLIFVSMMIVGFKGVYDIGGFSEVWSRVENNQRGNFFNFDFDPRTRHTFFTATIGGYFWYLTLFAATQAQVQRYLSMPNMPTVKRALFLNMIAIMILIGLCSLTGFVLYAKYYQCDPIKSGGVKSSDQLLPLFVMQTLGDIPGISGLFVAGITAGSLSTISSGLNAVSAIITYDYLVKFYPKFSDEKLSNLSKIVCCVFGIISFLLVFVAENMGNLVPVWNFLIGMILAPSLGVFTLGMCFPLASTKGTLTGVGLTLIFMIFVLVGSLLPLVKEKLPNQKLPLSISNCSDMIWFTGNGNDTSFYANSSFSGDVKEIKIQTPDWKEIEYDPLINLFSISYVWYSTIACNLTVAFGLLFSWIFQKFKIEKRKKIKATYLSPPIVRLFKLNKNVCNEWIEFDIR